MYSFFYFLLGEKIIFLALFTSSSFSFKCKKKKKKKKGGKSLVIGDHFKHHIINCFLCFFSLLLFFFLGMSPLFFVAVALLIGGDCLPMFLCQLCSIWFDCSLASLI